MSFSSNFDSTGFDKLLEEKSLNPEQKRRIIATSIALKLIAAVVTSNSSTYKLSEEMGNLSKYVDAIESNLVKK
jgi:hypothetical protein